MQKNVIAGYLQGIGGGGTVIEETNTICINYQIQQSQRMFNQSITHLRRFLSVMLAGIALFFGLNTALFAQTSSTSVSVAVSWNLLGNGTAAPINVASTFGDINSVQTQ